MALRDEIGEQPAVAARLLRDGWDAINEIALEIRVRGFDSVLVAARGTSDHAAIYTQYLFGIEHRMPVALAAPSITSLYGRDLRLRRTLVLGISQSGVSPDVVGVIEAARRQRAPTIAITNDPSSRLARAAEFVIHLDAGLERAIAATKTYTAELLAIAMLSAALGGRPGRGDLERVPDLMRSALEVEPEAREAALEWAGHDRCVVLGRGFDYATAREWSLKLKELARVGADPYSAADFQHGPLALIERGFPVAAVASSGAATPDLVDLIRALARDHLADLLVISDRPDIRALGRTSIPMPPDVDQRLGPIIAIVPAQLFTLHLCLAKGLDPEEPRNLRKVTETR